jgi:hypothetical protein
MGVRKYPGRGRAFSPKRRFLLMDTFNCCNELGSNPSCKEVREESPKSLIKTPVKLSTPLPKEEEK